MKKNELYKICEAYAREMFDTITASGFSDEYAYAAINRAMAMLKDYIEANPHALPYQIKQSVTRLFTIKIASTR